MRGVGDNTEIRAGCGGVEAPHERSEIVEKLGYHLFNQRQIVSFTEFKKDVELIGIEEGRIGCHIERD